MKITIQISNTKLDEQIFQFSAPDIDSAIAELGRYERIMEAGAKCLYCGDPLSENDGYCIIDCAEHYNNDNLNI